MNRTLFFRRSSLRAPRTLTMLCLSVVVGSATGQWPLAARADDSALSDTFTEIWRTHGWQGSVSKSGPGSSMEATAAIRDGLTKLIAEYNIESVLDVACGDFHWMQHVDLNGARYTGVDIVAPLIESLQQSYQTDDGMRSFFVRDGTRDALPKADLVIARDVIGHLTHENGLALIRNVRASGAKYFLSTYFTAHRDNIQNPDGGWRPVDLSLPPYNLGEPLTVIHEHCPEGNGAYADKELALWSVADMAAP